MAKLGNDWLYIGLGIGAIYLVYKLTSPITNAANSVSNLASQATQDVGNVLGSVTSATSGTATGVTGAVSSYFTPNSQLGMFDVVTKSPLVWYQEAYNQLISAWTNFTSNVQGMLPQNYSPVSSTVPTSTTPVATSAKGGVITYGQAINIQSTAAAATKALTPQTTLFGQKVYASIPQASFGK
jgi:hypothetical protein